jgi:hypothetical protein
LTAEGTVTGAVTVADFSSLTLSMGTAEQPDGGVADSAHRGTFHSRRRDAHSPP